MIEGLWIIFCQLLAIFGINTEEWHRFGNIRRGPNSDTWGHILGIPLKTKYRARRVTGQLRITQRRLPGARSKPEQPVANTTGPGG
jgi:hypothetical protein